MNIKLTVGLAVALTLSVVGLMVTLIQGEKTKAKLLVVQDELADSKYK